MHQRGVEVLDLRLVRLEMIEALLDEPLCGRDEAKPTHAGGGYQPRHADGRHAGGDTADRASVGMLDTRVGE